jgi:hypothetical protein
VGLLRCGISRRLLTAAGQRVAVTLSERGELSGDEVDALIARPEKAAARYQNIPSPIKFAPAARFIACAFYAPAPSQQRMQPRKT